MPRSVDRKKTIVSDVEEKQRPSICEENLELTQPEENLGQIQPDVPESKNSQVQEEKKTVEEPVTQQEQNLLHIDPASQEAQEKERAASIVADQTELTHQLHFAEAEVKEEMSISDIFTNSEYNGREKLFDLSYLRKLKEKETEYQVWEKKCTSVDLPYAKSIINSPLILLLKSGIVYKRSEGTFEQWKERFLMLSNCGLLYFKKGAMQPAKYKLLNNFIVVPLTPEEEKKQSKKNVIRVKFNKTQVKRDLFISLKNSEERNDWVKALLVHQIKILDAKIKHFKACVEEKSKG